MEEQNGKKKGHRSFTLRIVKPADDVDFKMRVRRPDPNVDYKGVVVGPEELGAERSLGETPDLEPPADDQSLTAHRDRT